MNESKQPGIKPVAILLLECSFHRYPVKIDKLHTSCNISYQNNPIGDCQAQGILSVIATGICEESKQKVYDASIKYIGIFQEDGEANLPLNEFMSVHAPAHIYPYLREYLSSLSMRSGMPMIVLPPLNIAALLKIDIEGSIKDNHSTIEELNNKQLETS